MYRGQHSNLADYIWPCTLQNQQLHLGRDTGTPVETVAETTKEDKHILIKAYCPHSVMFPEFGTTTITEVKIGNQQGSNNAAGFMTKNQHTTLILNAVELSMEKIILFQCDLMWENYIAAAYISVYSTDILPYADVTKMNINERIPARLSRLLCTSTTERTLCLFECNNRSARCRIKEIWDRREETAGKTGKKRQCKRKLMVNLSEAGKKRAKKDIISMCGDFTKPLIALSKSTDLLISNKHFSCWRNSWNKTVKSSEAEAEDHCSFIQLNSKTEAYTVNNTMISTFTCFNAQQKCNNPEDNCTICDGWGRIGSTLKDMVLSRFLFGDGPESVRDSYIPHSDSSVDYTVLGGSLQQKTHCEIQDDCDESLCLTSNTDSNINLNVRLPLHPFIPTDDVNSIGSSEAQRRKHIKWVTCENSMTQNESVISANILTPSPKWNCLYKTDLAYSDKENGHFGHSDESTLSTEETFSGRLNYPRNLEKQHFLPIISFSTLAASLLGTPQNDFVFLHSNGLQSTSKIECSHEMADTSLMSSFKHKVNKLEQINVEVLLSTHNINKRTGSVHLDYTTAFTNQAVCFPSHFQNTVRTQHSERYGSVKTIDTNWVSLCPKQLSFTESFKKISLDQVEGNNPKEIYYSFRKEPEDFKNWDTFDNTATMKSKPMDCKSNCLISNHLYANQSRTSDIDYKGHWDSYKNKEICLDIILNNNINETFACRTSEQNYLDPSIKSVVVVEENEHMDLDLLNKNVKSRVSPFTGSICSENTMNLNTKQDCEEMKGTNASPGVSKVSSASSRVVSGVPSNQIECEMKAQFDLVLEELKLFHKIGEEKENCDKAKEGQALEQICITSEDLPDIFPKSITTSNSVRYDSNIQDKIAEDKYVCARELITDIKEQEVPQQCWSACSGDEESLYSTNKEGDVPDKTVTWTPVFLTNNKRESSFNLHTEKEMTFSHGIRRVAPLKTRTGPLRIGLSKKAKIKQLHPYLRRGTKGFQQGQVNQSQ